jgi:hypothetical protein
MDAGAGRVGELRATPYDKRRGKLKNGNPSGDFSKAPRCRGGIPTANDTNRVPRTQSGGKRLAVIQFRRTVRLQTRRVANVANAD